VSYEPKGVEVAVSDITHRAGELGENWMIGFLMVNCVTESFLHIGSGRLKLKIKSEVKLPTSFYRLLDLVKRRPDIVQYDYSEVVRYLDTICIPGSTIKGACRARIELLATSKDRSVHFCFRQATSPPQRPPLESQHGWRHFKLWSPATWEIRDSCNLTRRAVSEACTTCDLFGAPGLASKVYFGNLLPVSGVEVIEVELDYGEKIELVPPKTIFRGKITFKYLQPHELGLLMIGLGAKLNGRFQPVVIGKSKYRARRVTKCPANPSIEGKSILLGRVRFSIERLSLIKVSDAVDKEIEKLPCKFSIQGNLATCTGDEVKKLVAHLVNLAASKFPELRVDFNEVEFLEARVWGG